VQIRDRIKELRRVPASELIPNPKNWRTHPVAQQDALRGVLAEVGYADALIARETPEGLMLVDGHLRAETTPDSSVPVLVLDIDEAEADLMLATLDPLAAMAGRDEERLSELLSTVSSDNATVNVLLQTLANDGPDLSFLDDALGADEEGLPFPRFDAEDGVEPDEDGLIRFTVPVTPEQRTQIMRAVNGVKASSKEVETTTDALVIICNDCQI
tara:strand:+ start:123 stop:764 length:642 start_codon:yes stop_codon:yes gene_type:complete